MQKTLQILLGREAAPPVLICPKPALRSPPDRKVLHPPLARLGKYLRRRATEEDLNKCL